MTRKNDFITWRTWSPFNLKLTGWVLISRKTSLEVQELQGHSPKCTNLFPDRGLREHLCVQLFNYECMLFQLLPWMLLLKAVLLQINRAMAMLSWTWIWKRNCWCNHGLALLKGGSKPFHPKPALLYLVQKLRPSRAEVQIPISLLHRQSLVLTNNTFTGSQPLLWVKLCSCFYCFSCLFYFRFSFFGRESVQGK